ncbi:SPN1 [Mytilus coruscus]|uniref:SPN1 n=1 Tax=Mytilus coruscus TaxID=42192 RepID=A0A6J8DBD2_MYTCO|nr:SPN1 [Mytilus coruscus]
MDVETSPRSGGSTPVQDEDGRATPVMDEMEGGGTPLQDEGGCTPVQDEGRLTPVLDEPTYDMRASPQDAEMESDNETDRGGGGILGNNDDDYVSDGGEVEREEVEPQSPNSGPASPDQSPPRSPDVSMSPVGSPRSIHSRSPPQSPGGSPVIGESGPQSPVGSPVGSLTGSGSPRSIRSGSAPASPVGSPRSVHSESQKSRSRSHSRSASPARSRSGSPVRSRSGSPVRSRSGSPVRSRSGSPRSRSGSPARSRSASPVRSRSGSPRSRSGSPARSRSGSPRSRSGSPIRSRSGSPRSRSASPARSRSGSPRSRSRSPARSRSGSPVRSRSGSPARNRSVSRSRSRSRSPARSRSASPAGSGRGSDSEDEVKAKKKKGSDDEDESDKESEVGELIANIFGSSDEEEEFVFIFIISTFVVQNIYLHWKIGFDEDDIEAANKKKEKKKSTAIVSDDENDEGMATGKDDGQVLPELSDDENEEALRRAARDQEDFVSDFDLMMERKKAEQRKQRRKKNEGDLINDNDDLIADMICKMKEAAEGDRELNRAKKPAIKKLKYLLSVTSQLRKADLQEAFLDQGILNAMTEWLAPLPDKSLPHLQIRENFLKVLQEFPIINQDSLKGSGIGKAVMYLYKHKDREMEENRVCGKLISKIIFKTDIFIKTPERETEENRERCGKLIISIIFKTDIFIKTPERETKENRERCGKLINEWSRPIFSLTANHKSMSKEEREERDYAHLPKRRRLSAEGMTPRRDIDKVLAGEDQSVRPGEKGFVMRARVPMPSNKDYVVRPKWTSEYEMEQQKSRGKKDISRYEKHLRAFADKKKHGKAQRAVGISIEGRNMAL